MMESKLSRSEVVRLGKEKYEREIRHKVEPEHLGKLLAVDVESGDFEVDREGIGAIQRLKARRPDAVLFLLRVGHKTAYKLGGRFRIERR